MGNKLVSNVVVHPPVYDGYGFLGKTTKIKVV